MDKSWIQPRTSLGFFSELLPILFVTKNILNVILFNDSKFDNNLQLFGFFKIKKYCSSR